VHYPKRQTSDPNLHLSKELPELQYKLRNYFARENPEQFHPFMHSLSFPSYSVPLIPPYSLSISFLSFFPVRTAVYWDVTPCSLVGTNVLVCDYNPGVIIASLAACLDYSSP
jgi:hypothetical protein